MKADFWASVLVAFGLFACFIGALHSCEADCEKRGGTLLRKAVGGWECVRVEKR